MSNNKSRDPCYFCKKGQFVNRTEEIVFHQSTDKGYVYCRINVQLGVCDACGAKNWNEQTEASIEEAVRREYNKLP